MSTLKSILTAVENIQRSWQDALTEVQLTMNCTANRVTKVSSLEILIRREARSFGLLPIGEYEDNLIDRESLRKQAKENIEANALWDKRRFPKNKAKIIKYIV